MPDYIQDIRALVGNTKIIMVACGAAVFDAQDRILLHRRSDNGYWGIPGGYMEIGETVQDTARREVWEETGLRLGEMSLYGIYSGVDHEYTLPNGHQVANVLVDFVCRDFTGKLRETTEESLEVRFFPLDGLPDNLLPGQAQLIRDLVSGKQPPVVS